MFGDLSDCGRGGYAEYVAVPEDALALKPDGRYVATGGSMAQVFQPMFLGPLVSMTGSKKVGNLLMTMDQADLVFIKGLIEAGEVRSVIDRCYPMSEIAEAIRYYRKGHARGKVVITMEGD